MGAAAALIEKVCLRGDVAQRARTAPTIDTSAARGMVWQSFVKKLVKMITYARPIVLLKNAHYL